MYLTLLILPLLNSIISGILGRKIGQKGSFIISGISITLAALLSILAFYEIGINDSPIAFTLSNWIDSEILEINWGFYMDSLTVSMVIVVLIVSACVHCYAIDYMNGDPWGSILGKCSNGVKLSNSGELLKLMVPNYERKVVSGWINYSGKVTSHKMSENKMDNRGSKSELKSNFNSVKEQRVDGNWCIEQLSIHLRYTLMDFERNYLLKIPSKQFIVRKFSTLKSSIVKPWFWSGLIDAEGSFTIIIDKN